MTAARVREVKIEYMDLEGLKKLPRNAKLHDEPAIQSAIGRFGYVDPIILDERSKTIAAGHGRLAALELMKSQQRKPPAGIKRQGRKWLVPVVRGVRFKDDRELEAFSLANNQLTIAAGFDEELLAQIFMDVDTQGMGFDPEYVQQVIDEYAPAAGAGGDEVTEEDAAPDYVSITVGYRIQVKRSRFIRWKERLRKEFDGKESAEKKEIVKRLQM